MPASSDLSVRWLTNPADVTPVVDGIAAGLGPRLGRLYEMFGWRVGGADY